MQGIARLTWERSLVQCLAQGHLDRWVIWALLPLTQNIVLVITFIGKCKLCRGRETKTSSPIGLFKSPASRLSPPPKWLTARCVHTVQGLAQFFISRPKFKQICWMWWDETTARPNNDSLSLCFLALRIPTTCNPALSCPGNSAGYRSATCTVLPGQDESASRGWCKSPAATQRRAT